jgi:predicted permease
MLRDLLQDLRYGLRGLRRSPGFAVMVVLTLALGIGANAAIFSLVNAVLLRPLPVREPQALVIYNSGDGGGRRLGAPLDDGGRLGLYSYALYKRLREDPAIELAAQDSNVETSVVRGPGAGDDDSGDRADGREVSANFFSVLGVPAHRGRTFLPEDETASGANPVVVLSFGYWQRRFGGNPAIIGARLTINGAPYDVLGVTPPGFTGAETGLATDFWVPVTMANQFARFGIDFEKRDYWWMSLIGRLQPGASMAAVEARATATLRQYLSEFDDGPSDTLKRAHIRLESGRTGMSPMRRAFREPLLVLMTGVGLLLLVVCLNVSYLLLARATRRQYELSIRTALGASRARLVRQLLTEGLLLSLLGALGGAVITRWLKDGLVSMVASGNARLPLVLDVGADGRVLGFLVALALATAALIGLAPALQAARANLQQAVRSTAQTITAGGARRLLSRGLMISQVAFSVVLLVGAGLLSGSLGKLRQVVTGFDEEQVLLARVNVQMSGLDGAEAQRVYDDIQRRVGALPGVRSVSLSVPDLLTGGDLRWGIQFPGTSLPPRGMQFYLVTPGYFETLGMKLLRGRTFTRTDDAGAQRVAVVTETMERLCFGGADALGKHFTMDGTHLVEVVGVVRDARTTSLRQPGSGTLYLPLAQPHGTPATLLASSLEVRAAGDPSLLAHQVRRAVHDAHSGLPFLNVRTLRAQIDRTLMQDRLLATLATAFGLTALFLVAVGLYGVIAQWAAQRTREIGVRMALGATSGSVRWLVLRQAVVLVVIGLLLGIPAALAASRLLKGMLFGVEPMHPPTVIGAGLVMFAVAALAAYLPARRASRVDPMAALRCE